MEPVQDDSIYYLVNQRLKKQKQLLREFYLGGQHISYDPNTNTISFTIGTPFPVSSYFKSWGSELGIDGFTINQEIKNYLLSEEYNFLVTIASLNKKFRITTAELGNFLRTHEHSFPYNGIILSGIPLAIMHEVV